MHSPQPCCLNSRQRQERHPLPGCEEFLYWLKRASGARLGRGRGHDGDPRAPAFRSAPAYAHPHRSPVPANGAHKRGRPGSNRDAPPVAQPSVTQTGCATSRRHHDGLPPRPPAEAKAPRRGGPLPGQARGPAPQRTTAQVVRARRLLLARLIPQCAFCAAPPSPASCRHCADPRGSELLTLC